MRLAILSVFLLACQAQAENLLLLPEDIRTYRFNYSLCNFWKGMPPTEKFKDENISRYCPGLDDKLIALKNKYASNKEVMAELNGYTHKVEIDCRCVEPAEHGDSELLFNFQGNLSFCNKDHRYDATQTFMRQARVHVHWSENSDRAANNCILYLVLTPEQRTLFETKIEKGQIAVKVGRGGW